MLPVTPYPPRMPGSWGSPFGFPRHVELRHHPRGYVIPKGCWIVHCTTNRVEFRIEPWTPDYGHRPPRPPPRPPPKDDCGSAWEWLDEPLERTDDPDCPPVLQCHVDGSGCGPGGGGPGGPGHNEVQTWEVLAQGRSGPVFADGQNVRIKGSGTAEIIRVFSV